MNLKLASQTFTVLGEINMESNVFNKMLHAKDSAVAEKVLLQLQSSLCT